METSQPFFSIVAPAYNVEGTIRTALLSVLNQSFDDLELIVVDDSSPDASGAIADEVAKADSRVTVIHSANNQGLGMARNLGMQNARGAYVLFLDTDDWFEDDALATIHSRIKETNHPELVIFDYARAYWWGGRERNVTGGHLKQGSDQPWTLIEHPELLEVLNVAWNKAYSQEFLKRTGLVFPEGLYEDIPFTFPALMEAHTIATVDFVAVGYRQSRGGSILRSSSAKHADVVQQWVRLMNYIDERPAHAAWKEPLYDRMVHHLVNLAGNGQGRIPAEAWNDFMVSVGKSLADHRPEGYTVAGRANALRADVLMKQNPALFRSMKAVNGTRISLRNVAGKRVRQARKQLSAVKQQTAGWMHQAAIKMPVEDLAVFGAYWFKQYAGNPRAIYEEMLQRPNRPRCVWIFKDEPPLDFPGDAEWVQAGSPDALWVMGRAKYLVNNVNFPDLVIKRPDAIHLQTQHGTPLKSMGLDLRAYPVAAKGTDFTELLARSDRWDLNLSSNRYSTEVWARAFPCNFESFESGYPRNDVLVRHANSPDAKAEARRKIGVRVDAKVLLYMPTFRDYADNFDVDIDLDELAATLGPDWDILVRAHYFYDSANGSRSITGRAQIIDVSSYLIVEDAYLASDVLLTDYSSAMFDYANLDRAMVLYTPDWDRYRHERGLYFDIRKSPPGPVAATSDELLDIFGRDLYNDAASREARAEFRRMFCEFDDGHAAARVVDRLLTGHSDPRPSSVDLSALHLYPVAIWEDPAEANQ